MFPHERSLVTRLSDKPFALIGVNSDPDKEYYAAETVANGVSWRSFWNGPKGTFGPIAIKWGVSSWPTVYVVDHKGVIRFKNVRGEELGAAVDQLLEEMQAGAVRRQ